MSTQGAVAIVKSGVRRGERVVTDGQMTVKNGALVRVTQVGPGQGRGAVSLSSPFIRRPVATSLISAAIMLVGLVAYFNLPVSALPNVDFPTLQVSASLPGASPETMASNVATPLERQFSLIPGISQMTSVSSLGTTSITLQFQLGQSLTSDFQQVLAAINAASAQLPQQPAGAAHDPPGQSGRRADHDPVAAVGTPCRSIRWTISPTSSCRSRSPGWPAWAW